MKLRRGGWVYVENTNRSVHRFGNGVLLLLALTLISFAHAQFEYAVTAIEVDRRSSEADIGLTWDQVADFESEASKKFEQQLSAYRDEIGKREDLKKFLHRNRSISSYDYLVSDMLPVRWDAVSHVPWGLLWPELGDPPPGIARFASFLTHFNIEVIIPSRQMELPDQGVFLTVELFDKAGNVIQLTAPMRRSTENRYFLFDPGDFLVVCSKEIEKFRFFQDGEGTRKPSMELVSMTGFSFTEDNVSDWDPFGIPVVYNVAVGETRLYTGFQWGGRPEFMPQVKQTVPFLVE